MNRDNYIDQKKNIRFCLIQYSEQEIVVRIKELLEYAITNFTGKENDYQGYEYEYECEITDIALGLEGFLQKHPKYKKSSIIKNMIIEIIRNEKFLGGRSGFIFLLYILKMDDELRQIATERKEFWEHPRLQFQLLYAIYRRNIRGFEVEAEKLMNEFKKGDIHKYAKKYLEKMNK